MPRSALPDPDIKEDRRNRESGEQKGAASRSLIDELEASISQRNIGSKAEILRQITDLFVAGSEYFDGEQMTLFDDVMSRLVNEIDHSARVTFGETLATTDKFATQGDANARARRFNRCRWARASPVGMP